MTTASTPTVRYQVSPDERGRSAAHKSGISVISQDQGFIKAVAVHLAQSTTFGTPGITNSADLSLADLRFSEGVVYLPRLREGGMVPDFTEAEFVLEKCVAAGVSHLVLVSSALVYDANFRNPGLILECHPLARDRNPQAIASCWRRLENLAKRHFKGGDRLTILRCATVLSRESANCIVRSFRRRAAFCAAGHDPCLQLLSLTDLAHAIECVLKERANGIFNVAPDAVLPLRRALKRLGIRRIPVPHAVLALADLIRGRSAGTRGNFRRYSWTVSNEKIKTIGFKPACTSAGALAEFTVQSDFHSSADHSSPDHFDDFGMDPDYIRFYGRTLFRFLSDWYWRVEVAGLENIPTTGRALLAGTHRGFMPWDGVMALDLIVKRIGRYPRFLIHPGLVKFPFLANFMAKLGGIIACQRNAGRVLENDELLGVFPEGIQGAFVKYSEAYQIHDFHRDAFVKMALRHRAPIIPFVTVGSAEIFPILAHIKSKLWTRYTEWPAFPLTPTFPLLPVPLPSKWHTRFLDPLHIENDFGPEDAANAAVVRSISSEVRNRMQVAIDEMRRRRRSIFLGSLFLGEAQAKSQSSAEALR